MVGGVGGARAKGNPQYTTSPTKYVTTLPVSLAGVSLVVDRSCQGEHCVDMLEFEKDYSTHESVAEWLVLTCCYISLLLNGKSTF